MKNDDSVLIANMDRDEAGHLADIIASAGYPSQACHSLADMMKVEPNRIFFSYDPNSAVDVEINLGDDWAFDNPIN